MKTWNAVRVWMGAVFIIAAAIMLFSRVEAVIFGSMPLAGFLLFVGVVAVAFGYIREKRPQEADERSWHIVHRASRATFIAMVLSAFAVMLIDSMDAITLRYSYFMAYWVCGMVLVYSISYKLLEKKS
ncbi:MAG: DUF2178 domain-containing protein [Nanoarchaeota archaeon]